MAWVRWFHEVDHDAAPIVGGRNAAVGELVRHLAPHGIRVPEGFAVVTGAFQAFLRHGQLVGPLRAALAGAATASPEALADMSLRARELVLGGRIPADVEQELLDAYRSLSRIGVGHGGPRGLDPAWVGVRSSVAGAVADTSAPDACDPPGRALFVRGEAALLEQVRQRWADELAPGAIARRLALGLAPEDADTSVGVQRLVHADAGASGVAFTYDPHSGSRQVVVIASSWGLGCDLERGDVDPDAFHVHKETLRGGFSPIVRRRAGRKALQLAWDEDGAAVVELEPSAEERDRLSLDDDEVLELARAALRIEDHWQRVRGRDAPMRIEWTREGRTGQLYVLQARVDPAPGPRSGATLSVHRLLGRGPVLVTGLAVGTGIASGPARVLRDPRQGALFRRGEVLVAEHTDAAWEPLLRAASAVVTERGGRTSHAALVARELGIPAVTGARGALAQLATGEPITVSCAEGETGRVLQGAVPFAVDEVDPARALRPRRTKVLLNLSEPDLALQLAQLPCDGVGLMRMEHLFASRAGVHPMALLRPEALRPDVRARVVELVRGHASPTEYLVDILAQGIGALAAAFWPRPVTVRFSDFKTTEYARLLGGDAFEPTEENPMLGWRGASRFDHPDYRDGFLLEVAAVRRVRERFGLRNVHVMVPFCRTPAEGRAVLGLLERAGLPRGKDGLQVWVLAEVPANVILAAEFARLFDGISIGSNDLTQLLLGVDRDSERVAGLFDERDEAVEAACATLIDAAHRAGRPISICGQGPSDRPDFTAFLVARGIDSISVCPDALLRATRTIVEAERPQPPAVLIRAAGPVTPNAATRAAS